MAFTLDCIGKSGLYVNKTLFLKCLSSLQPWYHVKSVSTELKTDECNLNKYKLSKRDDFYYVHCQRNTYLKFSIGPLRLQKYSEKLEAACWSPRIGLNIDYPQRCMRLHSPAGSIALGKGHKLQYFLQSHAVKTYQTHHDRNPAV